MKRLRVRVELNRRKSGVPLDELVSVVDETRRFFHLLAEDVQIDAASGVWVASDFDPESLNFTAEYDGPASAQQIRDFGAAFGGSTSLRQETIAQFTHIADQIGEDELVGFGLYQSDQETEPSDWRCLSRRDALRFANEIHLLAKSAGESVSPLPPVMNGSAGGRRLFKDRREREVLATDPSKWIREVESALSKRIASLEQEVEVQKRKVRVLGPTPEAGEERLRQLITALESATNHAPRQLEAGSFRESSPAPAKEKKTLRLGWVSGFLLTAAAVALAGLASSQKAAQFLDWSVSHAAARLDARQDARQIALDIPAELKPMVQSEALINVAVTVDEEGKVTGAQIASTKGNDAALLVAEALKTARRFRFAPSHGARNTDPNQILSFVFEPDSPRP